MTDAGSSQLSITVIAERDPTVLAQLLGYLTMRGDVPEKFLSEKTADDTLSVCIEMPALDPRFAAFLPEKLRTLVSVISVSVR